MIPKVLLYYNLKTKYLLQVVRKCNYKNKYINIISLNL